MQQHQDTASKNSWTSLNERAFSHLDAFSVPFGVDKSAKHKLYKVNYFGCLTFWMGVRKNDKNCVHMNVSVYVHSPGILPTDRQFGVFTDTVQYTTVLSIGLTN